MESVVTASGRSAVVVAALPLAASALALRFFADLDSTGIEPVVDMVVQKDELRLSLAIEAYN